MSIAQLGLGQHETAEMTARESLRHYESLGIVREIVKARATLNEILGIAPPSYEVSVADAIVLVARGLCGEQPRDEIRTTLAGLVADGTLANDIAALSGLLDNEGTPTDGMLLAGALAGATVAVLRGERSVENVRNALTCLPVIGHLASYVRALVDTLDQQAGAASALYQVVKQGLHSATPAEQINTLIGVSNVIKLLGDTPAEVQVIRAFASVLRQVGNEPVMLSGTLSELAILYRQHLLYAHAVSVLNELVALDEQTNSPHLESHRVGLEDMRQKARRIAETDISAAISAWLAGWRDNDSFVELINTFCCLVRDAICWGSAPDRIALANNVARLRTVRSFPLPTASRFLYAVQILLREPPNSDERVARIRAELSEAFGEALDLLQQSIRIGKEIDVDMCP